MKTITLILNVFLAWVIIYRRVRDLKKNKLKIKRPEL